MSRGVYTNHRDAHRGVGNGPRDPPEGSRCPAVCIQITTAPGGELRVQNAVRMGRLFRGARTISFLRAAITGT